MTDNWKHRSQGMKCGTCMWFVLKHDNRPKDMDKTCATTEEREARGWVGRCRRHAPTMNGFPVVWQGDWCGDHKLDEQKA